MSVINVSQLNIDKWNLADMQKPENIDLLESIARDFSITPSVGDSLELYNILPKAIAQNGKNLQQKSPISFSQYQELIKKFAILSLPSLKLEVIENFISNDLKYILNNKICILTLLTLFLNWDKESFWVNLASFADAIRGNKEKLYNVGGSFAIGINDQPTIGDWVNDYIRFTDGRPSKMDELSQSDYFNRNDNYKKLSDDDKFILKKVLKLFRIFANIDRYLNYYQAPYLFDSEIQETAEENNEEPQTQTAPAEILFEIKQIYHRQLKKIWSKYSLDQSLNKFTKYNLNQLLNYIKEKLNNQADLLAILILINKEDIIDKVFENNYTLADLYSQQALIEFKIQPSNFNLAYLYYAVFKKANFPEEESVILMQYLSYLNKKLIGSVYADIKTNNFKWRGFSIENKEIIYK